MSQETMIAVGVCLAFCTVVGLVSAVVFRRASRRRHTGRPQPTAPQEKSCGCGGCPPSEANTCSAGYRCVDLPVPVIVDGATCDRNDSTRIHQSVLQRIASDFHERAVERETDKDYEMLAELAAQRFAESSTPKSKSSK